MKIFTLRILLRGALDTLELEANTTHVSRLSDIFKNFYSSITLGLGVK